MVRYDSAAMVDAAQYFLKLFALQDNWVGGGSDWSRVSLTEFSRWWGVKLPKGSVEANNIATTG